MRHYVRILMIVSTYLNNINPNAQIDDRIKLQDSAKSHQIHRAGVEMSKDGQQVLHVDGKDDQESPVSIKEDETLVARLQRNLSQTDNTAVRASMPSGAKVPTLLEICNNLGLTPGKETMVSEIDAQHIGAPRDDFTITPQARPSELAPESGASWQTKSPHWKKSVKKVDCCCRGSQVLSYHLI